MNTYLYSFENPDRHGIDEEDAKTIVKALQKSYPKEKFSSGVVNGVLGIRVEERHADEHVMNELRGFVMGALATRNLWER